LLACGLSLEKVFAPFVVFKSIYMLQLCCTDKFLRFTGIKKRGVNNRVF